MEFPLRPLTESADEQYIRNVVDVIYRQGINVRNRKDDNDNAKPIWSLRSPGSRLARRVGSSVVSSVAQLPPRTTRLPPCSGPTGFVIVMSNSSPWRRSQRPIPRHSAHVVKTEAIRSEWPTLDRRHTTRCVSFVACFNFWIVGALLAIAPFLAPSAAYSPPPQSAGRTVTANFAEATCRTHGRPRS